jgi:hypothetical protein
LIASTWPFISAWRPGWSNASIQLEPDETPSASTPPPSCSIAVWSSSTAAKAAVMAVLDPSCSSTPSRTSWISESFCWQSSAKDFLEAALPSGVAASVSRKVSAMPSAILISPVSQAFGFLVLALFFGASPNRTRILSNSPFFLGGGTWMASMASAASLRLVPVSSTARWTEKPPPAE